jgi:hypothetical protein
MKGLRSFFVIATMAVGAMGVPATASACGTLETKTIVGEPYAVEAPWTNSGSMTMGEGSSSSSEASVLHFSLSTHKITSISYGNDTAEGFYNSGGGWNWHKDICWAPWTWTKLHPWSVEVESEGIGRLVPAKSTNSHGEVTYSLADEGQHFKVTIYNDFNPGGGPPPKEGEHGALLCSANIVTNLNTVGLFTESGKPAPTTFGEQAYIGSMSGRFPGVEQVCRGNPNGENGIGTWAVNWANGYPYGEGSVTLQWTLPEAAF